VLTDLTALIPPAWREIVDLDRLRQISKEIGSDFIPDPKLIFRSVECAPSDVKVVIVGQDPYPNPQHAMGLAFSVPAEIEVLPASLKNIYKELKADLGVIRENGDLSGWEELWRFYGDERHNLCQNILRKKINLLHRTQVHFLFTVDFMEVSHLVM